MRLCPSTTGSFPRPATASGRRADVDADGRFTILFSSWLDHLGGGRHAVDGFVKVADLDSSIPAPFGNQCDMMYLNAGLQAGPYLRTILAHEYMHAVVYTRKSLEHPHGDEPGPEEDGWLDEALAHLVEDIHSFSPSNIDYRVSAFLSDPERYRLVVNDYFAADLFRSHGSRGSTYLFLRWCIDRYGLELMTRLVLSGRRGVDNLEAATGASFASLFRRWTVATFLGGINPPASPDQTPHDDLRSTGPRTPTGEWEFAGPRYRLLHPDGQVDRWEAAGTSAHYAVVEGRPSGAIEVEVEGPADAGIQVTAVPLGTGHARIALELRTINRQGGELTVQAKISEEQGLHVRLSALAWEPMVPGPRPRLEGPHPGRLDMLGVAASFGTSSLSARGELHSQAIRLTGIAPGSGPVVVKAVGTDAHGRRVTAWAELENSRSVTSKNP